MKLLGSIVFILFLGLNTQAQFDTNYVYLTKGKFAVYPLFGSSYSKMQYDYTSISGVSHISYVSRNVNSIGIGLSFQRLGFSLSYELPFSDIPELNKQRAVSFRGGYSYRRFYFDFRARYFRGLEQKVVDFNDNNSLSIRKDMVLSQIGFNLLYFTSRKYNFDANFKNYNLQKKSAISFIVAGGYNYYGLKGRLNIVDTNAAQINSVVNKVNEKSLRTLSGIAFSLVYNKFYFSAIGVLGLSFNKNKIDLDQTINYYWNTTPAYESMLTIGYSSESFFVSLVYSLENDRSRIENLYLGSVHSIFEIKAGKKIDIKYLGKIGKYL